MHALEQDVDSWEFWPSRLEGKRWNAPVSKSMAQRWILAAGMAARQARVDIVCPVSSYYGASQDIQACLEVCQNMGAHVVRHQNTWQIWSRLNRPLRVKAHPHESGTTLRYGMGLAMSQWAYTGWYCLGTLVDRPLEALIKAVSPKVRIFKQNQSWQTRGRLDVGDYAIEGGVSSQFVGGLLYGLAALTGTSTLTVRFPFESKPYVDMSVDVLRQCGVVIFEKPVTLEDGVKAIHYTVHGQRIWQVPNVSIEGDWSNGAMCLVAGVINRKGCPIRVGRLLPTSLQGDKAMVQYLTRMNARIEFDEHDQDYVVYPSELKAADFDVSDTPDLVPVLAIACACATGISHIRGAARLRYKESDRLKTVSDVLTRLGVKVIEHDDGLTIHGLGPEGLLGPADLPAGRRVVLDSHQDHRIVMMIAAASLRSQHVLVVNRPRAIDKSYPEFAMMWQWMGGKLWGADTPEFDDYVQGG